MTPSTCQMNSRSRLAASGMTGPFTARISSTVPTATARYTTSCCHLGCTTAATSPQAVVSPIRRIRSLRCRDYSDAANCGCGPAHHYRMSDGGDTDIYEANFIPDLLPEALDFGRALQIGQSKSYCPVAVAACCGNDHISFDVSDVVAPPVIPASFRQCLLPCRLSCPATPLLIRPFSDRIL